MIGGFNNAIYGRPGRDEEIEKVIASIQAAGKAGLPVIEYNWYAHRAMRVTSKRPTTSAPVSGGLALITTSCARRAPIRGQRPRRGSFHQVPRPASLPNEGAHTLQEMWAPSPTS